MSARTGPPKWERPRNHHEPGPHHRNSTFQTSAYSTAHRQCGSYADGLGRRREASYRLPVLRSGRSDPWWYQPPGPRGYEQAALHLFERGLLPAPNREGLKAMCDRQAAEHIAQAWGLVA
jgi:hypothetical protein